MKYIIYFVFFLFAEALAAQTPAADTPAVQQQPAVQKPRHATVKKDKPILPQPGADSVRPVNDTVGQLAGPFKAARGMLSYKAVLRINPYYNFFTVPQSLVSEERQTRGKESLFYILTGLLFFFALIKFLFNKYVNNLLGLVFRGSLRQKQIREQLLQTPLPSLFLNIFFVIVAGLYVFFLLQHYQTAPGTGFWLLLLYCIVAIGLVYLVKFLILKFTGWIFNIRDAADTYIFIVFLVNKLLAIFLLPLLIVMTFSLASWSNVLLTLSYIMVGVFFAYRYIVSFAPVRREVKVSQFHFFMYLCAFEIIPLLLIYKVLLRFF
ncbi:MAG TPA: DUF4271 domain-containing protein [Chitinophagaceae bacterium]|nr:DUF4271 domain-containing protein [Chitinophagaceae bacterium]